MAWMNGGQFLRLNLWPVPAATGYSKASNVQTSELAPIRCGDNRIALEGVVLVDPDAIEHQGQDMNQRASGPPELEQRYRHGKPALMLLLSVGLGLVAGCTTSSPGTDSRAPAPTPDQGAANPSLPQTPQESSQPDPAEGDSESGPDIAPESGGDEPDSLPESEPVPGPEEESEPADEPDSGNEAKPAPAPVTRAECNASPDAIQARMLDLINETRASARNCGTQAFDATDPLLWNDSLETAAAGHSLDMSSVNFFSHTGSNGSNIVARADAVNYDYRNLGENLAAGQLTAADAMRGLVNSPGHCANLMNPAFREVGVACSTDSNADYTYYWTQVFGRR